MSRAWFIVLAACGRVGFDPTDDGGGGSSGDSASSNDGITGDGAAAACPSFAIFCDGFESGALTSWTRIDQIGAGTAMVQNVRARTGMYSFEANKPSSGNSGTQSAVMTMTPQSTGTLFAREWMYALDPVVDFDIALAIKSNDDMNYTAVGGDGAGLWVLTEIRNGGASVDTSSTTPVVGINTWACIEVGFTFGTTPQVQVWIDGNSVYTMPASLPSPTYQELSVGAVRGDQLGFHVFIDDVVVANQRIGC